MCSAGRENNKYYCFVLPASFKSQSSKQSRESRTSLVSDDFIVDLTSNGWQYGWHYVQELSNRVKKFDQTILEAELLHGFVNLILMDKNCLTWVLKWGHQTVTWPDPMQIFGQMLSNWSLYRMVQSNNLSSKPARNHLPKTEMVIHSDIPYVWSFAWQK